jgi:hypothetical protein
MCGQAWLVQHQGVILCPRHDLRLDLSTENLTLGDLQQRLAAVLQAHAVRGCAAKPAFAVQGGMLCLGCQQCGCLEVVL